jgi:hypothetical protein
LLAEVATNQTRDQFQSQRIFKVSNCREDAMISKTNRPLLRKALIVSVLSVSATPLLMPSLGLAQQPQPQQQQQAVADPKLKTAMDLLKSKSQQLGQPKIEGKSAAGTQSVPAIYFGEARMNDNFALVDEVQSEAGGIATIFVRDGDQFIRVATNFRKDDGSRAVGTPLDPNGRAIVAIRNNQAFYGEADILGKAHVTAYEPIRDQDGSVIGIYFVGYPK